MATFAIGSVSGIYAPHATDAYGNSYFLFIFRTKINNVLNESQYYILKSAMGADEQIDLAKRAYGGRHCLHLVVADNTIKVGGITWKEISELEAI